MRIKYHNRGNSFHASKQRPWRLVYCESFLSEKDAGRREKSLKYHGNSLSILKKRISNSLVFLKKGVG